KPLIELEDESNIECSCVYPTCLVEKEDSLLLYASVSFQEHGRIPAGKGAIVAYSLRKDGLAYLRANRGYSRLLTKGLLLANGKISFNVCSTGGDFRVQICTPQGDPIKGFTFKECECFAGDSLKWEPTYESGRCINELVGQVIVLEIEFSHARLYAIRGEFTSLTPYQVGFYLHYGHMPPMG
ncbi:MAG: hypothetical protein RR696_15105, partial [Clostridia bacterium]